MRLEKDVSFFRGLNQNELVQNHLKNLHWPKHLVTAKLNKCVWSRRDTQSLNAWYNDT